MFGPDHLHGFPPADLLQTIIELQQANDCYAIVCAQADVGIFQWNLRTDEVEFTGVLKDMLGYEEHELPDSLNTWLEHIHPKDRYRFQSEAWEASDYGKERFRGCYRMTHRDGRLLVFLVRATILRSTDEMPTWMIGAAIEVTELPTLLADFHTNS